MKRSFHFALAAVVALGLLFAVSFGKEVHVKGYTRKDGTYVAPHVRTSPNSTKSDNWSTRGNVNPYTGKAGTKPSDSATRAAPSTSVAPRASGGPTAASDSGAKAMVRSSDAVPRVKAGMIKDEVKRLLGAPNIETANKWVYTNQGTVVFDAEGKVR